MSRRLIVKKETEKLFEYEKKLKNLASNSSDSDTKSSRSYSTKSTGRSPSPHTLALKTSGAKYRSPSASPSPTSIQSHSWADSLRSSRRTTLDPQTTKKPAPLPPDRRRSVPSRRPGSLKRTAPKPNRNANNDEEGTLARNLLLDGYKLSQSSSFSAKSSIPSHVFNNGNPVKRSSSLSSLRKNPIPMSDRVSFLLNSILIN